MIDIKYEELNKYIRDRSTSQLMADKVLAYGVGWALSRMVDVPGRQSHEPEIVFEENARTFMNKLVNSFNEKIPFNVDIALEIARYGWLLRYSLVSMGPESVMEIPVADAKAPFIVAYGGLTGFYNAGINEFCNANQTVMTTVVNRCMILLRGIMESYSDGV